MYTIMEMYCKYHRKHQSHFKYFDKLWRGARRVMLYPNQVLFLCMIHGRLCQFYGTVCFIFSLVCSFLEVLCSSSTTTCKNTFHLWNLLTEWPSFELLHRKNGFFQLQTSVQELLIRVQTVKGFFFIHLRRPDAQQLHHQICLKFSDMICWAIKYYLIKEQFIYYTFWI